MNSPNDKDLLPPEFTTEEWLEALMTPGSKTRQAWAEQNLKAIARKVEAGLRNPHREGQRVYGTLIQDLRVNDHWLIEIDDEWVTGMRYELPQADCEILKLKLGMKISGVLSFSLTSHWKGINLKGERAWAAGAIISGSIRIESEKNAS